MFSDVDIAIIIIVLADAVIIYLVNKNLTVPMVRNRILSFFLGKTIEDREDLKTCSKSVYNSLRPMLRADAKTFIKELRNEVDVTINNYMSNHMEHFKEDVLKEISDFKSMAASLGGLKSASKKQDIKDMRLVAENMGLSPVEMAMARLAGKGASEFGLKGLIGVGRTDAEMAMLGKFMEGKAKQQQAQAIQQIKDHLNNNPDLKQQAKEQNPDEYYKLFPEELNSPENNSESRVVGGVRAVPDASPPPPTSIGVAKNGTHEKVSLLQGDAQEKESLRKVQEKSQI
jgi:hypothetical protein